jgi:hypothetical protein
MTCADGARAGNTAAADPAGAATAAVRHPTAGGRNDRDARIRSGRKGRRARAGSSTAPHRRRPVPPREPQLNFLGSTNRNTSDCPCAQYASPPRGQRVRTLSLPVPRSRRCNLGGVLLTGQVAVQCTAGKIMEAIGRPSPGGRNCRTVGRMAPPRPALSPRRGSRPAGARRPRPRTWSRPGRRPARRAPPPDGPGPAPGPGPSALRSSACPGRAPHSVGKLSGGSLIACRIHWPASFSGATPTNGPFGHVPTLNTAPDRWSWE